MISETIIIDVVMAEAGLLGGAFVAFVLHGCWLWWYRRWSGPRLAEARAVLASALGESSLAAQDLHLPRWLTPGLRVRLLVDLARSLDGVGRRQLTALAWELGLIPRAEQRCTSLFWWRRLQGARHLTLMGGGEVIMPSLLRDPHPVVRAQAAEWAAGHPTLEVITTLFTLLGEEDSLSRFAVQDSLARMGAVVVHPLARYLSAQSGAPVEFALKVASGLADPQLLAPALIRCRDESPKVRALAATLVGALGGSDGVEVLVELLSDPDARVRAAAARALGRLTHWPAAPILAPLLRDRFWIVRREAGLALRALGAPGILFLRHLLSDDDAFAADMARQVLDLPDMAEWSMAG